MTWEQYERRADALWVLKALGALISCTVWPAIGFLIVAWPFTDSNPEAPFGAWIAAIIFFLLWYLLYFRTLCPWQRYFRECEVALRTGREAPKEPTPLSGTWFERWIDSMNRTTGQVHMPGYAIHPSEDGGNDLGQTGPLSRHTASRFGYTNKLAVVPSQDRPRCENCGVQCSGDRQCHYCGAYVHSDGSIDHEAEAYYSARLSAS